MAEINALLYVKKTMKKGSVRKCFLKKKKINIQKKERKKNE